MYHNSAISSQSEHSLFQSFTTPDIICLSHCSVNFLLCIIGHADEIALCIGVPFCCPLIYHGVMNAGVAKEVGPNSRQQGVIQYNYMPPFHSIAMPAWATMPCIIECHTRED